MSARQSVSRPIKVCEEIKLPLVQRAKIICISLVSFSAVMDLSSASRQHSFVFCFSRWWLANWSRCHKTKSTCRGRSALQALSRAAQPSPMCARGLRHVCAAAPISCLSTRTLFFETFKQTSEQVAQSFFKLLMLAASPSPHPPICLSVCLD